MWTNEACNLGNNQAKKFFANVLLTNEIKESVTLSATFLSILIFSFFYLYWSLSVKDAENGFDYIIYIQFNILPKFRI